MKINNETKVGALATVAITLLILGFNFLKGKSLFKSGTFVYAKVRQTKGLMVSNPVYINGLQVGSVYELTEANKTVDTIIIAIKLSKELTIPNNSVATIRENPLGTSSMDISLGTSKAFLKNHDTIPTIDNPGPFSQITTKLTPVVDQVRVTVQTLDSVLRNVNSVFNPATKNNMQEVIGNVTRITASLVTTSITLEKLMNEQNGVLTKSMTNLNSFAGNLAGNNQKINATMTNLETTTRNLSNADINGTISQLKTTVERLNTAVAKMDSKDGSIGRLLNDNQLYDNLANTTRSLNTLMDDIRVHPKRYVSISIFGGKSKGPYLNSPLPVQDTAKAGNNEMINKACSYALLLPLLFIFFFNHALAQGVSPADSSGGKRLEIIVADRYNFQKIPGAGDFVSLVGNVQIRQALTLFYCDSAVLNQTANTIEAFGKIHINDNDSVHIYSQYLKYFGAEKVAHLRKDVKLTDRKATLTTDELDYNTLTKIGTYLKGGKVVNGKSVLTSTEGYYYGETRDVYFKKKVLLNDPDYKVTTDTLLYNTYTEIARFVAPAKIVSGKRIMKTSEGFYDMKNKKAVFGKRSRVDDKDYTLVADDMAFDDAAGYGEAQGNVVYKNKDTANAVTIFANNMKSNQKTGGVLATQKPVMIIKQNQDSIFIAADTLYSGRLTELMKTRTVPDVIDTLYSLPLKKFNPKDSNSNRFVEAYFNVKIFSDSMQAVGDSMFYSFRDSVFRLFKSPIVWAQENQIAGDTIYLYTENQKPKRFFVFENALAINQAEKTLYNQVKGNTINGIFKDGNIDFFRAKGSAENIYYTADEQGGFIGVNRSTSDVIDVSFKERKPYKVVFRNNLQGTLSPIKQVNTADLKLRGFKWFDEKRPKSRFELLGSNFKK